MADPFAHEFDHVSSPATGAVPVTPHDTNALGAVPKALYVGTGGTITMRGLRDAADTVWTNVQAGSILPFRPTYIRATGTSAANILALT